jgi:hypothetical protein
MARIETAETTGELLARFTYADSWRQQYDERALAWYKLYVGWRDELPAELRGRSNLHIPRTYEEIDTLRARFLKALFASRPYIDFLPRPRGADPALMQELEVKARLAGALVDDQLAAAVPVFYDFITCFLVYPAAIASVGWRYETRKVRVRRPVFTESWIEQPDGSLAAVIQVKWVEEEVEAVERDDNDIQVVDFFDFWPDPRGKDIDSCRFVFQREWCTERELRDKLELLKRVGGGRVYEPDDWEALVAAGANLQDGREDRLAAIGLGSETGQGFWREPRKGYLMELLHYWEDGRHAIIVNRHELVYDGPNPYHRHGKKPFIATSFDPLPGEFYGLSAVQLIEHLQHELNTTRNQRIDNVSLVLNRMWKVRRSADINPDELISRPHGVVWVDSPDDVTELAMNDVTASSYNEERIIKEDMENVIGVPAVVRGVNPARRETATEVVTKNTSAGFRFDVKVMLYEALCLKRLAYLMDCNNQQFIDQPRLVRMFGDAGIEWRRIEPWEILGEHDYMPAASSVDPMANKEIRRQQLNEVMQIVLKTQNPFIDLYELTKLWLESYDIRSVDKLLKRPEELAQAAPAAPGAPIPQPGPGAGPPMGPEQVAAIQQLLGGGQVGPG